MDKFKGLKVRCVSKGLSPDFIYNKTYEVDFDTEMFLIREKGERLNISLVNLQIFFEPVDKNWNEALKDEKPKKKEVSEKTI
jgi:hypothetical protein